MASTELSHFPTAAARERTQEAAASSDVFGTVAAALASLRLTVALFALSMVLVLAGTLAQIDHDIWYVIDNYFRTLVAWVDLQIFFPRAWDFEFYVPMPGGWLIGGALGVNLLAAHALRFKVTARGNRLAAGLGLLALGGVVTWAVVQSGMDDTVESELSSRFLGVLWHLVRASVGGAALALAYYLTLTSSKASQSATRWAWWLGAITAAGLAILAAYLFLNTDVRMGASGLRILWQLNKATAASLILAAGCALTFGRRAGVVLLHGGIALMMFSELYTGLVAVETRMRLNTGEPVSYAEDIRTVELAIIDKSDPAVDRVAAVSREKLLEAAAADYPVELPGTPYKLQVHDYHTNAKVRLAQPGEEPIATAGAGSVQKAVPLAPVSGVSGEQGVDLPAAFVELIGPDDESSGVLLTSPYLRNDTVELGEKKLEVALRFERYQKPYTLTLEKFEHEKYVGAETAKGFKSYVRLEDSEAGEDRQVAIWMNNPLRYRGDALYQASFDPENPNYTELQVVNNHGWMIPYVACMIVATGMLIHFYLMLTRFVRRREEEATRSRGADDLPAERDSWAARCRSPRYLVPAGVVAVFAFWIVSRARVPESPATQMDLYEFAELPVAAGGRIQPLDSLARNTLRQISDREEVRLNDQAKAALGKTDDDRVSAIRWMLDTIARAPGWQHYPVFRITDLEVLQILEIAPRKGNRYSFIDLQENAAEFDRQVSLAREAYREAEAAGRELGRAQTHLLELRTKIDRVLVLIDAFSPAGIDMRSVEAFEQSRNEIQRRLAFLEQASAPRPVPPAEPDGQWSTLIKADLQDVLAEFLPPERREENAAAPLWSKLLAARRAGDSAEFNKALAEYQRLVEQRAAAEDRFLTNLEKDEGMIGRKPAEQLNLNRIEFEAYYNFLSPIWLSNVLYVCAFVLATLALLGWSKGFNRSANWLLWLTFGVHTMVLLCRIYISGRPPVTNLHSSAIFIGWAAVLFALVFETIYRMGIGNLLAPAIGFPSMLIAFYLAGDGDTFAVLQAVLDTQFWLATHVVCITLGYATTFLAGFLGIAYLLGATAADKLSADHRRQLTRMIYGTVCFSIFFSFVGTVLGGLWADDSWGRFWGWDPKENGALLIVLWNAIVLHARWGKMVGERGLAALAVFGNVVVAWSWFGVNQLEVGLHSYGRTDGLWMWLAGFALSQMAIIALVLLPRRTT